MWIIKAMKNVATKAQDIKHPILTIVEARKQLYSHRQRYDQNLLDFAEELQSTCKTIEERDPDVSVSRTSSLVAALTVIHKDKTGSDMSDESNIDELVKCLAWTDNHVLGMVLIDNADCKRHGDVQLELVNDCMKGMNNYPTTFSDCFALLLNHKSDKKRCSPVPPNQENDLNLAQRQVTPIAGTDGEMHPGITCNKCNKKGHCANKCPEVGNMSACQVDVSTCVANFNQVSLSRRIEKVKPLTFKDLSNFILLDYASTVHLFMNHRLVQNVRKAFFPLHLGTNNGTNVTDQEADFEDLTVWTSE